MLWEVVEELDDLLAVDVDEVVDAFEEEVDEGLAVGEVFEEDVLDVLEDLDALVGEEVVDAAEVVLLVEEGEGADFGPKW